MEVVVEGSATPPAVEHRVEGVIEEAAPPLPTRATTPPVQQEPEEERVDEEIVMEPPPEEEEAPSRGADAREAAADAAVTEGAGSALRGRRQRRLRIPQAPELGARGRPAPRGLLKRATREAPSQAPWPLQRRR